MFADLHTHTSIYLFYDKLFLDVHFFSFKSRNFLKSLLKDSDFFRKDSWNNRIPRLDAIVLTHMQHSSLWKREK